MAAKNMEDIALYLKKMKFRKKLIGGVDESDVWKQLNDLHKEYQTAFDVQVECSQVLLNEKDLEIQKLKRQIMKLKSSRGVSNE